jgi:hypothetical protein
VIQVKFRESEQGCLSSDRLKTAIDLSLYCRVGQLLGLFGGVSFQILLSQG